MLALLSETLANERLHLLAIIFNFNSSLLGRLGVLGAKLEAGNDIGVQTIFAQICRVFFGWSEKTIPSVRRFWNLAQAVMNRP